MYLSSKALIKKKTIVNVKKLNNVPMKPSQLNKVAARREREKRKGILFLSWEDEWEKSTRSRIFFYCVTMAPDFCTVYSVLSLMHINPARV